MTAKQKLLQEKFVSLHSVSLASIYFAAKECMELAVEICPVEKMPKVAWDISEDNLDRLRRHGSQSAKDDFIKEFETVYRSVIRFK